MALPYFQEFGWEPHILAVRPEAVEGVCDPFLQQTIPAQIPVTYIHALPAKYTKYLGLSNLGWRCLPTLAQAGAKLLKQQKFDLIYFSTTVFLSMGLAARWYKRFGVPYILDFQDPWLSDYFKQQGAKATPPGGKFKYSLAQFVARTLEPRAMRHVSHVTSVSPAYPQILQQRYRWLHEDQFTVLPFGAPERDFELLPSLQVKQSIFDPGDRLQHWVYVGRGGSDMALALRALFAAIALERTQEPQKWESVRLHFVGTSYATEDRAVKTIEPVAIAAGIGDLVEEHPLRVPYFEALQILADSDAILLIGSDDPNYSASKIYPCILAQKPILAIFHQQSLVVDILHRTQAGQVVTFGNQNDLVGSLANSVRQLLTAPNQAINWSAFEPYTARRMTEKLCQVFEQATALQPDTPTALTLVD